MNYLLQVAPSLKLITIDALLFLSIVAGGVLLALVAFHSTKFIFNKATKVPPDLFSNKYRTALIFCFVLVASNIGIGVVQLPIKPALIIDKVLYLLLIFSVAHLAVVTLAFMRAVLYHKYDTKDKDNLEERKARTQIDFLQRTGTVLVVVVAFAIALMSFSKVRELGTSILASAGLAGIILGFAAQKSIGNILAGLQIAFTQPIRLEDAVMVEGQFGRIEEISLTYVVVKIWDERRLVLPISYFIEKPFENWTRNSADMLGAVLLYVDYTLPIEPLRTELTRILTNEGRQWWDGKVGVVQVTDCTAQAVQLRILISATDSGSAFDLRCVVRESMIKFIRNHYPESLPKQRLAEISLSEGADAATPSILHHN